MRFLKSGLAVVAAAAFLVACGGGGDAGDGTSFDLSNSRGSLIAAPSALATLTPAAYAQLAIAPANATAAQIAAAANVANVLALAGTPVCNVTFNYFQYGTVGGAGEKTNASGGIIVPSGTSPACQGPRPVLLYAHGTTLDKNFNMASPQNGEAFLIAALYAARGFIVVAPNYAGYEASTLPYHPYLNIDQQSKDMIDGLTAARKGFAAVGASANDKLFVSGYSQGGTVSMATQRALQLAGTPVTAGAHLSGVYALGAFGDAVYSGVVNAGATLFAPLLNTSFQKAYGNLYASPSEMYEAAFATGIETLLPSTDSVTTLLTQGKLPQTALFAADQAPAGTFGFGTRNLIRTSYRNAVLADAMTNPAASVMANLAVPQHPLRVAAFKNDLLNQNWTPAQPMFLCGGKADPTVFYGTNTTAAKTYFDGRVPAQLVTVLDVDTTPSSGPFAPLQQGFAASKTNTAAVAVTAGATDGGVSAVAQAYHGAVAPFCNAAARGYFNQILMAP